MLAENNSMQNTKTIIEFSGFSLYSDSINYLKQINLRILRGGITSVIGPAGSYKSYLLKSINRLTDLDPKMRLEGDIIYNDISVFDKSVIVEELRREIGFIFQIPNPFPFSIYENLIFGLNLHIKQTKSEIMEKVEKFLTLVDLWKDYKDKLNTSAMRLTSGQKQRLCIARSLIMNPKVLLMDEPADDLDIDSMNIIESILLDLKKQITVIIATHNNQQAARLSEYTAFIYKGEIVEYNQTQRMFTNPLNPLTEKYLTGRL